MEKEILVVGINASPLNGTVADIIAESLIAVADEGVLAQMIHLKDIPHHDGRREEERPLRERIVGLPLKGNLRRTVQAILVADGVIFATPVHCFNLSSRMMALFSWLMTTTDAPDYVLKGKVAAFMSVCEEDGAQSANEKMMGVANHLGFIVPPFCSYFFNKNYASKSEGDWQITDRALVGLNVVRMIRVLRGEIPAGDWGDYENNW